MEAREASLELPGTLKVSYDIPEEVETLDGFNLMTEDEMPEFLVKNGLAMDIADLRMCRDYFQGSPQRSNDYRNKGYRHLLV